MGLDHDDDDDDWRRENDTPPIQQIHHPVSQPATYAASLPPGVSVFWSEMGGEIQFDTRSLCVGGPGGALVIVGGWLDG